MISEVVSFYNDSVREMKSEFETEFNRIVEEEKTGWYTFYFSSYQDYTIRTEFMYCYINDDTALFFVNPCSMLLTLSGELMVNNGDILSNGDIFEQMFYNDEVQDVEYIDDICNMNGFYFGVYSFKTQKALDAASELLDNEMVNIDHLTIDEDDLTEVSLDYLDERIAKFEEQVDKSFELEEPIAGLDENPYSNDFYDHEYGVGRQTRRGPINKPVQLGDDNV